MKKFVMLTMAAVLFHTHIVEGADNGEATLVPPAMAAYKVSEYWKSPDARASMEGCSMIIGGMVSGVDDDDFKIEFDDGRVVCESSPSGKAEFKKIADFHAAGEKCRENKSSNFSDFLIKVVLKGRFQGQLKPGRLGLDDCEILGWYGVEVTKGWPKKRIDDVLNDKNIKRPRYRSCGGYGRRSSKTLSFKAICRGGSLGWQFFQNIDHAALNSSGMRCRQTVSENGMPPIYLSGTGKLKRISGRLSKVSDDEKLEIKNLAVVALDSDPLDFATELKMICDIAKRKKFNDAIKVDVRAEFDNNPGRTTKYKNGIIDKWITMDPHLNIYKPNFSLRAVPLTTENSLGGGDDGAEDGSRRSIESRYGRLDKNMLIFAAAKLADNRRDPAGMCCLKLLERHFDETGVNNSDTALKYAELSTAINFKSAIPSFAGERPSAKDLAESMSAKAQSIIKKAENINNGNIRRQMFMDAARMCVAARTVFSETDLNGIFRRLKREGIKMEVEALFGISPSELDGNSPKSAHAMRVAPPVAGGVNGNDESQPPRDRSSKKLAEEVETLHKRLLESSTSRDFENLLIEALILKKEHPENGEIAKLIPAIRRARKNQVSCPACGGKGILKKTCPVCKGAGTTICAECGGQKWIWVETPCDDCGGSGRRMFFFKCRKCGGDGKLEWRKVCDECEGKGELNCDICGGDGKVEITCPVCDGEESECPPRGQRR